MNNYSQIENKYLRKGHVIKKVEKRNALHYIHDFVKQRIIQAPVLKSKNQKNFSFNTLHHFVSIKDLNGIRMRLFNDINKDKKFRNNFFLIAKNTLFSIVGNELAMQNKINLSIQFPNDDSSLLPLHSDTWDGDSPFESVLWLPLVNCFKTKSMFILKSSKYEKFRKIYKKRKIKSVSHLYNTLKKDLDFIKINYGNFLLF